VNDEKDLMSEDF